MRKGNFQAERIWTLEIFVQKWYLLVSYIIHRQTHPATLGRLQKGPFSVAEQREAGVLGELSQRLYTSLWLRTKLQHPGSQGPEGNKLLLIDAQWVKCAW